MKVTDYTAVLRSKVAVCGNATVGKSALISMYTSQGQKFPKTYSMTLGVDIVMAQVPIPDTTILVELFLYDTAGFDVSKDALAPNWDGIYYAILVYDVSSQESFESCKEWLEELKKARLDRERPLKAVLVATKSDLPAQRHQVSNDVAEVWANANGMEFFAVSSAPPGLNLEAPFTAIGKAIHKNYEEKLTAYQDACQNY
mmetsp:Transcript_20226/g.56366  ORF Transcript_20226/g.56366 Transcript_20226/m.56366 type:complete len:200 (+) Transcript_20226:127-726(+)